MSLRVATFRPIKQGLFAKSSESQLNQLSFTFPVSAETPLGYHLSCRVPGLGSFVPKNRYEITRNEWRSV